MFFIQVPLDADGKPDLELPRAVIVERLHPGIFMLQHDGEVLVIARIGTRNGEPVFYCCTTTPNVSERLTHLGAKVRTLAQVKANPTLWTWLKASGLNLVRDELDVVVGVVPPVVVAGQSGVALALEDD